jgi:hypothetical protein
MINCITTRTSTSIYFSKMEILKLGDIHKLVIGLFMYNYKKKLLPPIFMNFFSENRDHHNYPTRVAANLCPPIIQTKIAENFVRKTGSLLWNTIEGTINTKVGLITFKKHLKKHILSEAFTS